jgi:hypothetical protein
LLEISADDVAEDRVFSVGIDAGTSGIRVAIHDESKKRTTLYDFGPNRAGGTRFSFPAVVAVIQDRLSFGNDAVDAPVSERFISVKGGLVHQTIEEQICASWTSLGLHGADVLTNSANPSVVDFLYSATLARALEVALPGLLPDTRTPAYLTFTVGAPLNQNDALQRRFEMGIAAAVLLAGNVGARPRINDLVERFLAVVPDAKRLTQVGDDERRIWVRSEAHCAILPLRRVFQPLRNFLVADIGATTTDLAVIRIGDEQLPFCYAIRSAPFGVDTIDRARLQALGTDRDVLSLRVERAASATAGSAGVQQLGTNDVRPLREALALVLSAAIYKNDDQKSWNTLYVVVVGGGSRVPALRDQVLAAQAYGWIKSWQQPGLALDLPAVAGHSRTPPGRDEEYELSSVLGSATPVWDAGDFATPDRVPRVISTYEGIDDCQQRNRGRWV